MSWSVGTSAAAAAVPSGRVMAASVPNCYRIPLVTGANLRPPTPVSRSSVSAQPRHVHPLRPISRPMGRQWGGRPSPDHRHTTLGAETKDSGDREYQDSFEDTTKHMLDLFTYRAVKVVLGQLFETDAPMYKAMYDFSLQHKPQQSYPYLVALTKAEPEMGRRVMATREALFKEFIQRLQDGHGDNVMGDSNMQVLKDVLTQSWAAQAQVDQASDSDDYP